MAVRSPSKRKVAGSIPAEALNIFFVVRTIDEYLWSIGAIKYKHKNMNNKKINIKTIKMNKRV